MLCGGRCTASDETVNSTIQMVSSIKHWKLSGCIVVQAASCIYSCADCIIFTDESQSLENPIICQIFWREIELKKIFINQTSLINFVTTKFVIKNAIRWRIWAVGETRGHVFPLLTKFSSFSCFFLKKMAMIWKSFQLRLTLTRESGWIPKARVKTWYIT